MASDDLAKMVSGLAGALLTSTRFLEVEANCYRERGGEKNISIAESIEGQIGLNRRALDALAGERASA
jgi:hypothetical protein